MTLPHITVTSTGLNAGRWAERCTESVGRQTYEYGSGHIYVANDDATRTSAKCGDPTADVRLSDGRPLLANLLPIWRALPDDEVIAWLDGDDWLATDRALEVVANVYASSADTCWLTYGQFIWSDGLRGFAAPHDHSRARSLPWYATHLKTFRAGLVKRIKDADLRQPDGSFVSLAIDQAVMLPMLEMAAERARFIPQILYVYNEGHSYGASGNAAHRIAEAEECYRIRRMPPYERLAERPW